MLGAELGNTQDLLAQLSAEVKGQKLAAGGKPTGAVTSHAGRLARAASG